MYGLQLPAFIDQHQADLRILAANYVKQVRAIQPSGPYNLAGHSSGGLVVFEMACQLVEQGETVGLLALLDCDPNTGKVGPSAFQGLGFLQGFFSPHARAEFAESKSGIKEFVARKTDAPQNKNQKLAGGTITPSADRPPLASRSVRGSLLGAEGLSSRARHTRLPTEAISRECDPVHRPGRAALRYRARESMVWQRFSVCVRRK